MQVQNTTVTYLWGDIADKSDRWAMQVQIQQSHYLWGDIAKKSDR